MPRSKNKQVELTGVPVRLYTENTYTEATVALSEDINERSTYWDGFCQGPTAAIVKDILPMCDDEIWKVTCYNLGNELKESYNLLVIEDVAKEPITMVGQGPVRARNFPEAILATMLSPVKGPTGGKGPNVDGVPRRPGLILLEEGLARTRKQIKNTLLGSGVEVKVHNKRSNLCGNAGCYRVGPEELLDCPCEKISYCSEEY